jgi:arabinofuranosyltransferase
MEITEITGRGRFFIIAGLALLVCLFYFSAAAHFDYTTDDSYIYFQYARNLSGGEGWSFNAGTPSYGFTSPLWMMMISAGGAAGADIPTAAKILDLLFASMSVVLLFFLSFELTRDVAVSFCATLAFSVNAWLLRWAGSGLETSLAIFLLLAFFRYLLRNEYQVAAGVLGLLTLARPEAALLLVPLVADLRINSVNRSQAFHTGVRMVSVWLVIVLPWLFAAYAIFGTVIPATFGAKHGALFDPGEIAGSASDVIKTLGSADGVSVLCLFVSVAAFAVRHRRMVRAGRAGAGDGRLPVPFYHYRQSFAGVSWAILLPLFYMLFSVNVVSRYFLIVTPIVLVMGFFYFHELFRGRSPVVRYGLVLALTALVMIQSQVVYKKYALPHMAAFSVGMEACLEPIGRWLGDSTPPGTVVMTADVGAVGYFSGRFICDFNGIVSPGATAGRKDNDTFTEMIRQRRWGEVCVPDYIVHRSTLPEELKDVGGLVPVMSKPFPGLSISDDRTVYFTIYRVGYTTPEKLLTVR